MSGKHTTVRFLTSSALSLLGNSIAGIVLPLVLLATTGDPLAAGALALICALPQFFAGIFGGAVLDRFNRRDVSVISDIISAASVALLPLIDILFGLNFWWFVAFGLLGSIGDIPGMTARDTLLPAVTAHDKVNLQRFMGLSQSLDSIVAIVGPALAALFVGFIGGVSALWLTALTSLAAALVTATIPRPIGAVSSSDTEAPPHTDSLAKAALASFRTGMQVLFRSDSVLRMSVVLSLGIIMVLGSFQGLVLPVHFTVLGRPELLGYTLSALSAGLLVGSLIYAALAPKISRRAWYFLSFAGMGIGIAVMGLLPPFPILLLGAAVLGLSAGPASALLGFFMFDRIPEEKRGAAFGTQNSLLLIVAPLALFACSALVSGIGLRESGTVLILAWLAVTAFALTARGMLELEAGSAPGRSEAAGEAPAAGQPD